MAGIMLYESTGVNSGFSCFTGKMNAHKKAGIHSLLVEKIDCYVVDLPAVRDFSIAGGVVTRGGGTHPRVLVRVRAGGLSGWGAATPAPTWTYETTESITSTITRYLAPALIGHPVWDLDGAVRLFDQVIRAGLTMGMPLARSALDLALHDLLGRALGLSVGELWGQRRVGEIPLCWIASDDVDEGLEAGYRAFKVKVGLGSLEADVRRVEAVRAAAPDATLWVDANQAYTFGNALRLARALDPLGVAVLEQPLRANDPIGHAELRRRSPIPVALDESLVHPTDLAAFARLGALDIAVAKVQRSGGLHLSRRMCALAEDFGLSLIGSGLTDCDLGLAASLHLFAAFGMTFPADLNGRQFVISRHVLGPGVDVSGGVARVPTGPGLGVEIDEDYVRGHLVT